VVTAGFDQVHGLPASREQECVRTKPQPPRPARGAPAVEECRMPLSEVVVPVRPRRTRAVRPGCIPTLARTKIFPPARNLVVSPAPGDTIDQVRRLPVAPVAWEPCAPDHACGVARRLVYTAPVPNAGQLSAGPLGLLGLSRAPSTTPGGLFMSTVSSPSDSPTYRTDRGAADAR
jgi:hypothetical protein